MDTLKTLGRGLAAGAAGTVVMTGVQMLEMKLIGRGSSTAPADAVEKVSPVEFKDDEQKQKAVTPIHFAYGTGWGVVYAGFRAAGLPPAAAGVGLLSAVWGNALWMLPALDIAPHPKKWGSEELAKDAGRHAVYAAATSAAYELLDR